MKNLLFSLLIIFWGVILNAQTQKSHWAMHPNEVDFTSLPATSSTLNALTFAYTAGNSAYDPQGNLLFYVHDNQVYDAAHNSVGVLSDYFSGPSFPTNIVYSGVQHEIALVPFSETCEKYYVIFLAAGSKQFVPSNNAHQALLYSVVEITGSTVSVTSQTGSSTAQLLDRFNPGNLGGIAVSPELAEGGRFLFCVAGDEVNRYFIDDNGITFEETIANVSTIGVESDVFDLTELELFWEGSSDNFKARLGWGQLINVFSPNTAGITIDLNIQGEYLSHTVNVFPDLNNVVGFEFNPKNYNQYFICARDHSGNTGVYFHRQNKRGPLKIDDSDGYWSHIELGRDKQMHIAEFSTGNPAFFDPTLPPFAISGSGLSNFESDQNEPFVGAASLYGFFSLPDQIDGINNTFYPDPVSDFTVNGNSLPDSWGPLPPINICQPIVLDDLTENGHTYRVTLEELDGSGTPIAAPTQPWLSTLTTDLKSIPYDFSLNTLSNPNNTGNYRVTVEVRNLCQVIDTKYGYFSPSQPLVSTNQISINGETLVDSIPNSSILQTFSCSSQSIILDNNGWNGNQYKVTLESVNSNGNLISGAGVLGSKTTLWHTNFNDIADLKNCL